MATWRGNTAVSATSTAYSETATIGVYSLTNKTAGNITVNLGIINGATVLIAPKDMTIAAGNSYYGEGGVSLPGGATINVTTTGSLDYYFSIK